MLEEEVDLYYDLYEIIKIDNSVESVVAVSKNKKALESEYYRLVEKYKDIVDREIIIKFINSYNSTIIHEFNTILNI